MSNFRADLEAAIGAEPVERVCIGAMELPDERPLPSPVMLTSWAEAAPILDYDYDTGFGGAECHPVYVWTPTRVIFVAEYDGATSIVSVPRNPAAIKPSYDGNYEPGTFAIP